MNPFARARGPGAFAIAASPLERMLTYRQDTFTKTEAGGVLIGRHLLNDLDVIADAVTEPMRGDRRSRTQFVRAAALHQREIDRAWAESDGTATYLGEWHTHPEAHPVPSGVDVRNWRRKLKEDAYSDVLFFVIIGTASICAWEGVRAGELVELPAIHFNR